MNIPRVIDYQRSSVIYITNSLTRDLSSQINPSLGPKLRIVRILEPVK